MVRRHFNLFAGPDDARTVEAVAGQQGWTFTQTFLMGVKALGLQFLSGMTVLGFRAVTTSGEVWLPKV